MNAYSGIIGFQSYTKKPYGSRFVADSHKCTTKPSSGYLLVALITNHFRHYRNGIFCRTGNCFWIIDNTQQVVSTLNKINYISTAKHKL